MRLLPAVLVGAVASTAMAEVLPLQRRYDVRSKTKKAKVPITGADYGLLLDVEVTIGGQKFLVVADTGSADFWVLGDGYECISATDNSVLPQSACLFANTTYHQTSTFKQTPNETFGTQYGVGIVVGVVGTDTVSIGGLTVPEQTFGVVERTTTPGSGIDSGILGLGYPILTSAHPGDTIVDNTTLLFDRIEYSPLFNSLAAQGSVEPWFSFSIDRVKNKAQVGPGGYLALGELAPVAHYSQFSVAPVEITDAIPPILTNNTPQITEWTLTVPEVVWGPADNRTQFSNTTAFQAVVDTGNPFIQFPEEIVDGILSLFDPAPVPDLDDGVYRVDCDVKVPKLGIAIANQTFYLLDEDMVLYNFLGDGGCVAAFLPSATGMGVALNFIGDPLLKNVVSVFDFGKNEMRFAARKNGGGTDEHRGGNGDDEDDDDDDGDD